LQSAPTGTYSGIIDCARKTIAVDGMGALWKGFGPAMARAFPANAATFVRFIPFVDSYSHSIPSHILLLPSAQFLSYFSAYYLLLT
jgi:hypothetical protein